MLVIRLQRKGRRGHAQFRVVVQDSRFSPTSGRVVAYVGSYDPHSKATKLDEEKISGYLATGAQPSPRVTSLLKAEKVKLPTWVKAASVKKSQVRYPEKRRSTRPEGVEAPTPAAEAEVSAAEEVLAKEEVEPTKTDTPAAEEKSEEPSTSEAPEEQSPPEEAKAS